MTVPRACVGVLSLLALSLPPQAPSGGSVVDERVLACERIVVGRVERIEQRGWDLPRAGEVASTVVRVERRLVGPEGEDVLSVFGPLSSRSPRVGQRALFFLVPWNPSQAPRGQNGFVQRKAGGAGWVLASEWSRGPRGAAAEVALPEWLALARQSAGAGLELDGVLADVEASLARCLPRLTVSHGALGPGWSLSVGPDRRVIAREEDAGELPPARWGEVLEYVELALGELPDRVGRSLAPDSSLRVIHLHTRAGVREVRIEHDPPEGPAGRSEWELALALWNVVEELGRGAGGEAR